MIRTLDRYVIKNFLVGYVIAFCVLMGLRIMIDLFVNLDEFAENEGMLRNILLYYGMNATLYYRDFGGMIMVVAAAFSFGKMIRNSELIAVMASGVSLKRTIAPVLVISIILTMFLVIDQEYIIPPLSSELVRSHDDKPGEEVYSLQFLTDTNGSLIYSYWFDVKTATLLNPTIILRELGDNGLWEATGWIKSEKAIYNKETGRWDLLDGKITHSGETGVMEPVEFYVSGLSPADIPIRLKASNKTMLSFSQLSELARIASERGDIKDLAQLYSQKHFRITDPLINFVTLLIALPILVCRDPRGMKNAVMVSFSLTGACMMTTFACKLLATEEVFGMVMPEFWSWLAVFIFLPIAFIEFDIMKT
jgi:lipopolysaccharide export LptBFGC system permease protein LptF